jgi:hypothetical protein
MDRYMDGIQASCIQWFLILYHWITEYIENGYTYSKRIVKAIADEHKEKKWIFVDANTHPIEVRGEYNGQYHAIYMPDKHTFRNPITEGGIPRRFHVVIVELEREGMEKKDLTELFHRVTWSPGTAPSLLEMVQLQGMYDKEIYQLSTIKKWKLSVLDDNADQHTIELRGQEAEERFRGWPNDN